MRFSKILASLVRPASLTGLLLLGIIPAKAATVAYWRFEGGFADAAVEHLSGADGAWSADIPDASGNNNALSVWNSSWAGFFYKADVPAATVPQTGEANALSVKNQGNYPAGWTESLKTWSPTQWTVEAAYKPQDGGFRTIVGRDSRGATANNTDLAAMYFQLIPGNAVAIKYADAGGVWHEAVSAPGVVQGFNASTDPEGTTGKWYAIAATSDGQTLSLYLSDIAAGTGYQLIAQTDLAASGSTNTALSAGAGDGADWDAGNFTVARGLYAGNHGDRAYGFIDEVRLSDTALNPTQFLFAVPSQTQITGTVTDQYTGQPVAGATVTLGQATTITNSSGVFVLYGKPGTSGTLSVTAPYADAPYSTSISFPAGGSTTRNVTLPIRPNLTLTTANGFNWKLKINTGGAADLSAVAADETGFADVTVPANWDAVAPEDDIYGWYRLRFTLPANFNTLVPNRLALLRVTGDVPIDDVDATYVNGTLVGQTGSFPNPPLDVQATGHVNHATGEAEVAYPGLVAKWKSERAYYFPTSLLKPGQENVIAVKVFDWLGGGGITGTPTLQIAPATGTISGTVKAGGTGIAGVRVAASDATTGLTNDWTLTDAGGAFTLSHVLSGAMVVGAAKPGYTAAAQAINVAPGSAQVANLTLSAVTGGPAPDYDDFSGTGTAWQARWDAVSEVDPTAAVTVTQPGINVADFSEITGTVTVEGVTANRSGILSKSRFNRFASVNSARLVSAAAPTPPTGTLPNVILQLKGSAADDNPANVSFTNVVEYDIEGYKTINGEQRIQVLIWGSGPLYGSLAAPVPIASLADVSPTNPIDMTITRVGSYYDFYMNGQPFFDANIPITDMVDHKVFLYSYQIAAPTTWDWVKVSSATVSAAPLAMATQALRIAGGLEAAGSNFGALNVNNAGTSANKVDILDAVALAKQGL